MNQLPLNFQLCRYFLPFPPHCHPRRRGARLLIFLLLSFMLTIFARPSGPFPVVLALELTGMI